MDGLGSEGGRKQGQAGREIVLASQKKGIEGAWTMEEQDL